MGVCGEVGRWERRASPAPAPATPSAATASRGETG